MAESLALDLTCSCGKPGCPELGWPHEWNPVDFMDTCVLCPDGITPFDAYQRWGSGYAHESCIAIDAAVAG